MDIKQRSTHFFPTAILGAITVLFFIGIRYGEPPWEQKTSLIQLGLILALGFILGLALIKSKFCAANNLVLATVRITAIASMVCLPVLMIILLTESDFQKLTLLSEFSLVYFLLLLHGTGLPKPVVISLNLIILAVSLQSSFSLTARASLTEFVKGEYTTSNGVNEYIFSPLHDLNVSTYKVIPNTTQLNRVDQGGAIEPLDATRTLLIDGNGDFYLLTHQNNLLKYTALLQLHSPMNRESYKRDLDHPHDSFRITDMLLLDEGIINKRKLYVVHHQWDEDNQCTTLNLDETELDLDNLDQTLTWTTRFKSTPCLPPEAGFSNETGGRLAILSDDALLLTVGVTLPDKKWNNHNHNISYGKILKLDRHNWTSKVFSTGHRNPQGLLVADGMIWGTEHGPNGGDELNLILEGNHYGWPNSSYGVDYGKKTLEGNSTPGEHSTNVRPVYSWVPSIGVARLIKIKGNGFSRWHGDLLVGSLSGKGNGKSLFRIRVHQGSVKTVEQIPVGQRVRDMFEMENGEILTWDGNDIVQIIAPASHVFSECIGCHVVNDGFVLNGIGPDLWGIVNQPVAKVDGFHYSNSMQNFGGRWTKERLDLFLRNPTEVVPGTEMSIPGIQDDAKRHEIIEYLENIPHIK